jgi:LDH2 family malate/lactate/ureidoglycolate dehydrogenase
MVLPRFVVPEETQVLVPVEKMRAVTHQLLRSCGLAEDGAAQCADVLIKNDLRGNESHGVSNMLRQYVSGFQRGLQNPTPEFRTLRETPGTALIDADGALGIHVGPYAMRIAIQKASTPADGGRCHYTSPRPPPRSSFYVCVGFFLIWNPYG